MKKVSFYSLLFSVFTAAIFSLVACNETSDKKPEQAKLSIVATIYPEYDWIKEILGSQADSVNLTLLLKNGIDLHSIKPTAQDIAKIASADMVVYVGGESDEWIEDALKATPKKGRSQINLVEVLGDRVKAEEIVEGMQGFETKDERRETREDAEENHEHGEEADEHVWLSLKNAEILVKAIAAELAKLDLANASLYAENANGYIAKIKALDGEYRTSIEKASRKTVLFGDRFPFRYLVGDYSIKYYAAFVGCSAESEASFETIAFLAGKMDSDSLPAIFTLENSNKKIANAILAASKNSKNAQILEINSMQSITEQQIIEGFSYLSIMQKNLDVLKKALK